MPWSRNFSAIYGLGWLCCHYSEASSIWNTRCLLQCAIVQFLTNEIARGGDSLIGVDSNNYGTFNG